MLPRFPRRCALHGRARYLSTPAYHTPLWVATSAAHQQTFFDEHDYNLLTSRDPYHYCGEIFGLQQ